MARHDSLRTVPAFPIPSIPKKQMPRKDGDAGEQSNTGEARQMSKANRDVQVTSASAVNQTQKAAVHHIPGVSMPMPFHQQQVPVQFGGPNPSIQSKGMAATSLPIPMPMPLPVGNTPQLQQPVFVSSLQPHPMQPQGIMHQGPSLNFSPQMGPHLLPQLVSIGPQFTQHQAGKFGVHRKPVKITHPDTHEGLMLDKSHPNVPQSQPITSVPPAHPINYYSNSYNPNPLFYPPPSSVPMTGTQINPSTQAPRFSYPVSQGTQTLSFVNPSAHNSYSGKNSAPLHGIADKDDVVPDNLLIPTSLAPDDTNAKSSSSSNNASKTSISDVSCSKSDSFVGRPAVTKSVLSDEGEAPVSTNPSVSELTSKCEGTGDVNIGLVSLPATGSKDKPVLELRRSKSNVAKGKKKRKQFLQKAAALGTTSDLHMAYKGPEEKKETVASSESCTSTSSINSKQLLADTSQVDVVSREIAGQSKPVPDDWEDAADISTPKLESVDDGKQVREGLKHHSEDGNGVIVNKYSRDFLLKISELCTDLPEGFEITTDIAKDWMVSNPNASREAHPSPGRIIDRPSGISRSDRRGSGMGDDDKWSKLPGPFASGRDPRMDGYGSNSRPGPGGNYGVLRNPRAQSPSQYVGGILSGPMQSMGSQGGSQRNTPDSDRWQRATSFQKGLIPSPPTPSQVMHKAEKKYEVGKVTNEEAAKQRQLKAILNKLTPQNFEKLFEQVKAVNIDSAVTLTGVISQIFDKALIEQHFCDLYANFCYHLAGDMPDFSEDNEKITFKRLLLNRCQEEFERVEREHKEADRANDEGEVKQSEKEREEKRFRARRRMLGIIRLIGELYKKRMLTERLMHECIKKLLGQYQNPDEEDIEALCILMSTIGEMIDYPKAKEHMDVYFDMMAKLSNNMKLSCRLRFMLKDAIELRKNKWQ